MRDSCLYLARKKIVGLSIAAVKKQNEESWENEKIDPKLSFKFLKESGGRRGHTEARTIMYDGRV